MICQIWSARMQRADMSQSLNSLKRGYIWDYIGTTSGDIKGDTRSLDYSSRRACGSFQKKLAEKRLRCKYAGRTAAGRCPGFPNKLATRSIHTLDKLLTLFTVGITGDSCGCKELTADLWLPNSYPPPNISQTPLSPLNLGLISHSYPLKGTNRGI